MASAPASPLEKFQELQDLLAKEHERVCVENAKLKGLLRVHQDVEAHNQSCEGIVVSVDEHETQGQTPDSTLQRMELSLGDVSTVAPLPTWSNQALEELADRTPGNSEVLKQGRNQPANQPDIVRVPSPRRPSTQRSGSMLSKVRSEATSGTRKSRRVSHISYGLDVAKLLTEPDAGSVLSTKHAVRFQRTLSLKYVSGTTMQDKTRFKQRVDKVLKSATFDVLMGVVIVANSITIGLDSSAHLENNRDAMDVYEVLESLFLCMYIVELAFRFYVYKFACLRNGWVKLDLVLVILGILGNWVASPIISAVWPAAEENDSSTSLYIEGMLGPLLVLRAVRILRLARTLRLVVQFRPLWLLVSGLLKSAGTIVSTFGLILVILYIFSVIGIEMITIPYIKNDFVGGVVQEKFRNIPFIMITLFQLMNLDAAAEIYLPMVKRQPYLVVFFLTFILLVSVALMNLVTAVIVEGAMEQAKENRAVRAADKKKKIRHMVPTLRDMLVEADTDNNKVLTLEEFMAASPGCVDVIESVMGTSSMYQLFEVIDHNRTGMVSIDDFCEGLAHLATTERPIENFFIMKQLDNLLRRFDMVHHLNSPGLGSGAGSVQ